MSSEEIGWWTQSQENASWLVISRVPWVKGRWVKWVTGLGDTGSRSALRRSDSPLEVGSQVVLVLMEFRQVSCPSQKCRWWCLFVCPIRNSMPLSFFLSFSTWYFLQISIPSVEIFISNTWERLCACNMFKQNIFLVGIDHCRFTSVYLNPCEYALCPTDHSKVLCAVHFSDPL